MLLYNGDDYFDFVLEKVQLYVVVGLCLYYDFAQYFPWCPS